jgi:C-terminal processing protease CtpA/Prc
MLYKRSFALALCLFSLVIPTLAQFSMDERASPADISINRDRGLSMLEDIKGVLKEKYYDRTFHGLDLDEKFKAAAATVKKLETNQQIFRVIAQILLDLNDSHTTFIPPPRANRVEYGFSLQMVGDRCFVITVKKDSDAEKQGLKPGDQITAIGRYQIDRGNLWKLQYILYQLDPQESVKLFICGADGAASEKLIHASFKSIKDREKEAEKRRKEKKENPYKCQEISPDVIACKLETFAVDKKYIDKMMGEVGQHKKLILDLRGNGGGYVKIEEYLSGFFFDHDVKIATLVRRDKKQERIARPVSGKTFSGELLVLIDSDSASASEVFARLMQIEKRGKIVGDVSMGAVMTSQFIPMVNVRGIDSSVTLSAFAMSVTIGDLIMNDGNRLENVGVIPDYPIGPSGKALAANADAVLAYSAALFGAKLSPEDAGKYYFLTKKPEDEDKEIDADDN